MADAIDIDLDQLFSDTRAAAVGDEAAIARLHNVQISLDAIQADRQAYFDSLVPADAVVMYPCVTREWWQERYGSPMPEGAMTDIFGCRIDPVSGYRLPADCFDADVPHAPGTLCDPNRAGHPDSDIAQAQMAAGHAQGMKVFGAMIKALLPVIGPIVTEGLAPLIKEVADEIGGPGTSFLAKEIGDLAARASAAVQHAFESFNIHVDVTEVKKTFRTMCVAAKTVASAVRPVIMSAGAVDPRTALTYTMVRENIAVAQHMLKADAPSINAVKRLAIDTGQQIATFAAAQLWKDAKKSLAGLTSALDGLSAIYGPLDPNKLGTILSANFPPLSGANITGHALELSNALVDRYAGQAERMTAAYDPQKIAALIPDAAARGSFLTAAFRQQLWDMNFAPFMEQAEHGFALGLDELKLMEGDVRASMGRLSGAALAVKQKAMRTKADAIVTNANRVVAQGARYAGQLTANGEAGVFRVT